MRRILLTDEVRPEAYFSHEAYSADSYECISLFIHVKHIISNGFDTRNCHLKK